MIAFDTETFLRRFILGEESGKYSLDVRYISDFDVTELISSCWWQPCLCSCLARNRLSFETRAENLGAKRRITQGSLPR